MPKNTSPCIIQIPVSRLVLFIYVLELELRLLPPVHIKATKSVCNADIPEDRQTYAEVMYDVFTLNKKKKKKIVKLILKY